MYQFWRPMDFFLGTVILNCYESVFRKCSTLFRGGCSQINKVCQRDVKTKISLAGKEYGSLPIISGYIPTLLSWLRFCSSESPFRSGIHYLKPLGFHIVHHVFIGLQERPVKSSFKGRWLRPGDL